MTKDARKKLYDYLESVAYKRFKWGEHDCCTFARDVVQVLTGKFHPLPAYTTMFEARNLLEEKNVNVREWVSILLRREAIEVTKETKLGECCIVQLFRSCGGALVTSGEIVDGPLGVWFDGSVYLPGRQALLKTSMENIIAAWTII